MKLSDFFETSHFLEDGETANNNPPAIFFNGGVIMRKTVKIIAILTMLVLMFAGVSVAGIPAAERDALIGLYNNQHRGINSPSESASTLKCTVGLAGFSLLALSASELIPRRESTRISDKHGLRSDIQIFTIIPAYR